MSRWKVAGCWLMLAWSLAAYLLSVSQGLWFGSVVSTVGICFWSANVYLVSKEHRGYRKAARDRDDSYTGTGITFAAGGPINPSYPIFTSTGLTFTGSLTLPWPEPDHPGIKESTAEVPILAYKVARLVWLPNLGPAFQPLNQGGTYGADADAQCNGDPYAMTFQITSFGVPTYPASRGPTHAAPELHCHCGFYACTDRAMLNGGAVILEVELSGKVIVCERGYRAGHQRVIRAHLRGCHYCGTSPSVASFEPEMELRLRCAQHADATPSVPIAELTTLLGCTVDVDSSVRVKEAS